MKKENIIDLIISDVIMPDNNGLDLTNSIKIEISTIKVLFITGYIDKPLYSKIKEQNYEILEKPFTTVELLNRINKVLS